MSETKRPLWLAVIMVAVLCAVSVLGGGYALAFAEDGDNSTPEAVEYSKDPSKWTELSAVTVDATDGMYATAASTKAATDKFGSDATIDIVVEANVNTVSWGYDWVIFKSTNEVLPTAWDPLSASGSGNWLAVVYGASAGNASIWECNNGVISKTPFYTAGVDTWYPWQQKTEIIITTQDTDTGVSVTVSYCASESNRDGNTASGAVKTTTYESVNTLLWGEQNVIIGHRGSDPAGADQEYRYSTVSIAATDSGKVPTDTAPELDPANLAQSMDNWSREGKVGSDISADAYGLKLGGTTRTYGILLDKNIAADSTLAMTLKGKTNHGWGAAFVVFKNMTAVPDSVAPLYNGTDSSGAYKDRDAAGSWMALMFGSSYGAAILECVDGVVQKTDITKAPTSMNGNDYNYFYEQDTEITIATEDNVQDGTVAVTITFVARNCVHNGVANTGRTYTIQYTTKDTTGAFIGDYAFSVGMDTGAKGAVTLSTLKVDGELVDRPVPDDGLCNFANDIKYWKGGTNIAAFEFDQSGMTLWDVDRAEMMLNQKVESSQTLSLTIDGSLKDASYGNYYFIMNFDEPGIALNGNLPTPKGNRLAIVIGGDGFLYIHSTDGQWTNGVTLDGSKFLKEQMDAGVFDGTVQLNDYNGIFKDIYKLSFEIDSDENGVDIVVTIHTPSGKTGVAHLMTEYSAKDVENGYWFNIGYYLGANCGDDGNVTVSALKIDGVEEGYVAPFDTEEEIEEMQSAVLAAASAAVTDENFEELKDKYEQFAAFELSLNYNQLKNWVPDLLANLKSHITAFPIDKADAAELSELIAAIPDTITASAENAVMAAEELYAAMSAAAKAMVDETSIAKMTAARATLTAIADRADADAVLALIAAIPTEITVDNKAEANTKISAAESAYAALSENAKAMVGESEAAKITAARAAVDALESTNPGTDPEKPEEKPADDGCGCGSITAASVAPVALALLGGCVILLVSRKRKTAK